MRDPEFFLTMTPAKVQLKKGLLFQVLLLMYIITRCKAVAVPSNTSSSEYNLRLQLKKNYDPMVRPVQSPDDKLNISFSAKLISLIGLDIKKQMATTKWLIVQKWHNPFLVWKPSSFLGLDQIRMSSKYVWVPDIKLQNRPDNPLIRQENLPLYKSWVAVYSNGTNVWMSLEVIDSECDIDIALFPFDNQTCHFFFSSESYESRFLEINFSNMPEQTTEELNCIPSGEWDIDDLTSSKKQKPRDFVPGVFTKVDIKVTVSRRKTFYVLYFILPCVVLALLMFISFVIPPDSGERIGFCSSLLLALSVYLLIFTELLPNSRSVSLLGALFVVVFLETALALLATVVVMKAFYGSNDVPQVLGFFCGLGCERNKVSKVKKKNAVKPSYLNFWRKEPISLKDGEPRVVRLEETRTSTNIQEPMNTSGMTLNEQGQENKYEENRRRWSRVARKLDRFFFWAFMLGMLASVAYMIFNAKAIQKLSI